MSKLIWLLYLENLGTFPFGSTFVQFLDILRESGRSFRKSTGITLSSSLMMMYFTTSVLQLKKRLQEKANPFKNLSLQWREPNLCLCPLNQECQNWDKKSKAFVKLSNHMFNCLIWSSPRSVFQQASKYSRNSQGRFLWEKWVSGWWREGHDPHRQPKIPGITLSKKRRKGTGRHGFAAERLMTYYSKGIGDLLKRESGMFMYIF